MRVVAKESRAVDRNTIEMIPHSFSPSEFAIKKTLSN
jgi:hypothetical protein